MASPIDGERGRGASVQINGWRVYAHPLFLDQLEALISEVEKLHCLAAIVQLMLHHIPQDPSRKEYRQGSTLGSAHRHWRRAKFFQQYRLFFRFHATSRVVVLGWVNDTATKRAYGSRTDAYRVFQAMLDSGHPPNDWDELLQEA
jgi:toxin YhaV